MVIEIAQVIQDFAIIMIVAAIMALISYKLKQPLVIGILLQVSSLDHTLRLSI